jgi:hypothetical protein
MLIFLDVDAVKSYVVPDVFLKNNLLLLAYIVPNPELGVGGADCVTKNVVFNNFAITF